jgi:hypothetical protein
VRPSSERLTFKWTDADNLEGALVRLGA